MPIYEYKCNACGKEFEYQQRMSDPDKTECEACGKSALERLISRTAFALKGSGWYKDLYASSKPAEAKKEGAPEAAPKTDAGTSTTTKTESTPAATPVAPSSGDSNKGGGSSTASAAATAKAS